MKQELVDNRVAGILTNNRTDMPEDLLRKSFDPAMIPDTRPAYEGVWTDPTGRMWVRLPKADNTAVTFDLFDAQGRWLDQLAVPEPTWAARGFRPTSFTRTHVAVPLEDDDGLPFIRIYRIQHPD